MTSSVKSPSQPRFPRLLSEHGVLTAIARDYRVGRGIRLADWRQGYGGKGDFSRFGGTQPGIGIVRGDRLLGSPGDP